MQYKCQFNYGDGYIELVLGARITPAQANELSTRLRDVPKIPHKINGKKLLWIITDDMENRDANE